MNRNSRRIKYVREDTASRHANLESLSSDELLALRISVESEIKKRNTSTQDKPFWYRLGHRIPISKAGDDPSPNAACAKCGFLCKSEVVQEHYCTGKDVLPALSAKDTQYETHCVGCNKLLKSSAAGGDPVLLGSHYELFGALYCYGCYISKREEIRSALESQASKHTKAENKPSSTLQNTDYCLVNGHKIPKHVDQHRPGDYARCMLCGYSYNVIAVSNCICTGTKSEPVSRKPFCLLNSTTPITKLPLNLDFWTHNGHEIPKLKSRDEPFEAEHCIHCGDSFASYDVMISPKPCRGTKPSHYEEPATFKTSIPVDQMDFWYSSGHKIPKYKTSNEPFEAEPCIYCGNAYASWEVSMSSALCCGRKRS